MPPRRMALTAAEIALIQERRRLDTAFNAGLDAALAELREQGTFGINICEVENAIASIDKAVRKEVL